MKRLIALTFVASLSVIVLVGCNKDAPLSSNSDMMNAPVGSHEASLGKAQVKTYEIKFENVVNGFQPLSPPALVTHRANLKLYQPGKTASYEVSRIAQDADYAPLVDFVNGNKFADAVVIDGGPLGPGATGTYTVEANPSFFRLSVVSMLVNTNDAFVGVNGIKLPNKGSKTYDLYAYDAGSEANTELAAHIPGPCCGNPNAGVSTSENIHSHSGILGTGDLDIPTYDWTGVVAKLTITAQ